MMSGILRILVYKKMFGETCLNRAFLFKLIYGSFSHLKLDPFDRVIIIPHNLFPVGIEFF